MKNQNANNKIIGKNEKNISEKSLLLSYLTAALKPFSFRHVSTFLSKASADGIFVYILGFLPILSAVVLKTFCAVLSLI